jgi:Na+:H+ antiporter, NhaA family
MLTSITKIFKTTFLDPLTEFIHDSRAIGVILLCCTFISLIVANIPAISSSYLQFWNTEFQFLPASLLPHSLLHFINDGLMAVFFFLAGMEIKRELMEGELSSIKKSILPVAGAVGGMLVPAIIFLVINASTIYKNGWAIPTATDIAFSLGVASLLGNRVPIGLKIFLTALAIIDDLGAIIVIAIFYGSKIKLVWLGACLAVTLVMLLLNKWKAKPFIIDACLGIALWFCMYNSGLHATIAGVIAAFTIPTYKLQDYETKHHNLVYFFILPIFALANTAIVIPTNFMGVINTSLTWGIVAALLLGKPLGIFSTAYFLVKMGWAELPTDTNWNKMIGIGILAGIGFTMSIFISTLAFGDSKIQDVAKIAVLIASITAIIVGLLWLRFTEKNR